MYKDHILKEANRIAAEIIANTPALRGAEFQPTVLRLEGKMTAANETKFNVFDINGNDISTVISGYNSNSYVMTMAAFGYKTKGLNEKHGLSKTIFAPSTAATNKHHLLNLCRFSLRRDSKLEIEQLGLSFAAVQSAITSETTPNYVSLGKDAMILEGDASQRYSMSISVPSDVTPLEMFVTGEQEGFFVIELVGVKIVSQNKADTQFKSTTAYQEVAGKVC
jgi:hypothetical protein